MIVFCCYTQNGSGAHRLGTRVCFFMYKWSEHEGEYLPSVAEAYNGWHCDIVSPMCISGISLGHRSNFYKDLQV